MKGLENLFKNTCDYNLVTSVIWRTEFRSSSFENLADFVETYDATTSLGRFKGMFASFSRSWRRWPDSSTQDSIHRPISIKPVPSIPYASMYYSSTQQATQISSGIDMSQETNASEPFQDGKISNGLSNCAGSP